MREANIISDAIPALGCRVTGFDKRAIESSRLCSSPEEQSRFNTVQGDLTVEESIAASFRSAVDRFGPVNILVANAGITDESAHPPIWEVDAALWDKVRGNCRIMIRTMKLTGPR